MLVTGFPRSGPSGASAHWLHDPYRRWAVILIPLVLAIVGLFLGGWWLILPVAWGVL